MSSIKRINFQRGPDNYIREMAVCLIALGTVWAGTAIAQQQGYLENPLDFSYDSGVSAVTGFHCTAQTIEIQFDQYDPIPAAAHTPRADTLDYCGRSDTGFSLLWNWNILGPGQHTVRALADGVEFDSATIFVSTFGEEFVLGLNLHTDLMAVSVGKEISLRWQESKQSFVIDDIQDAELSLDDILAAISGNWTGYWYSPTGNGTINMNFIEGFTGFPSLDQFGITSTGCASDGFAMQDLTNLSDPIMEVLMDDGSMLKLEFMVTESFTTLGGVFWIEDGPCAEMDGMFYMFK